MADSVQCDPSKISVETVGYGTFGQPASPSLAPFARPHVVFQQQIQHQVQAQLPPATPPAYHAIPVGYHSISHVVVAEGIPIREPRLFCGGIGIGWILFLSGFFLAMIPWYVGVLLLLVGSLDHREKPGLIACTVAAVISAVPISFRAFFDYFS